MWKKINELMVLGRVSGTDAVAEKKTDLCIGFSLKDCTPYANCNTEKNKTDK